MQGKTQRVKVELVLNVPVTWSAEDVKRYLLGCMALLVPEESKAAEGAN